MITNSKICSATVQNAALRTMRPYKFTLGVTYSTTRPQLEKLMQDLQAMLDASPSPTTAPTSCSWPTSEIPASTS